MLAEQRHRRDSSWTSFDSSPFFVRSGKRFDFSNSTSNSNSNSNGPSPASSSSSVHRKRYLNDCAPASRPANRSSVATATTASASTSTGAGARTNCNKNNHKNNHNLYSPSVTEAWNVQDIPLSASQETKRMPIPAMSQAKEKAQRTRRQTLALLNSPKCKNTVRDPCSRRIFFPPPPPPSRLAFLCDPRQASDYETEFSDEDCDDYDNDQHQHHHHPVGRHRGTPSQPRHKNKPPQHTTCMPMILEDIREMAAVSMGRASNFISQVSHFFSPSSKTCQDSATKSMRRPTAVWIVPKDQKQNQQKMVFDFQEQETYPRGALLVEEKADDMSSLTEPIFESTQRRRPTPSRTQECIDSEFDGVEVAKGGDNDMYVDKEDDDDLLIVQEDLFDEELLGMDPRSKPVLADKISVPSFEESSVEEPALSSRNHRLRFGFSQLLRLRSSDSLSSRKNLLWNKEVRKAAHVPRRPHSESLEPNGLIASVAATAVEDLESVSC